MSAPRTNHEDARAMGQALTQFRPYVYFERGGFLFHAYWFDRRHWCLNLRVSHRYLVFWRRYQ